MMRYLILAYKEVNFNKKILFFLLLMFSITAFYPSDMDYYKAREKNNNNYVYFVEEGLRFTNTAIQIALPILLADKIGIIQAAYVGIATTISVHFLKRAFNDINILKTRLGERPIGSDYNVPSGHSAMATSAMAFVMIRYRWIYGLYLVPVSILTMLIRVLLKAHTISAVCSGAILGIIIGILLSSQYTGKIDLKNLFRKFRKLKNNKNS